ncbi:MAG: hypothetical protein H7Z43_12415 [Clostridia bacterium]|nr:hypothetical protein [Deltaproteobacteria bacterium]
MSSQTTLPVTNATNGIRDDASTDVCLAPVATAGLVFTNEDAHFIADRLDVDADQVPHLVERVRAQLSAQQLSFDSIVAITNANGVSEPNAIAALVSLAAPPKGDESLGRTTEPALVLAIYVTVFAADRFAMTLPASDAMRVASLGSELLGRMAPEDIALTALAVGRIVNAMPDMTRPEAIAAVTSLISTCPEAVAHATRGGTLDSKVAAARSLADSHGDLGNRGQAFAAAFTLLTNCQNDGEAHAIFSRAVSVAYGAAPQVILSCARGMKRTLSAEAVLRAVVSDSKRRDSAEAPGWDDRLEARLSQTLDRLGPFLDEYDRVRAKKLNAVPRVELILALHSQLTRGGPQFYVALLSLLRRHSALCTRQGSRALRNVIVSSDERVGSYPQPVFA